MEGARTSLKASPAPEFRCSWAWGGMVWTFGYEAMSPAGPSHLFASLLLGVLLTIIFMPEACFLPLALVLQNTLASLQLDEKASAHPRPLQLLGRVEPGSRQVLGAELEFHQQQWVGSRPDFHYLLCVLARDPVMDSEGPSEGLPSMPGSGRPGDPWGPGTQSLPTLLTSPHCLCPLQLADGVNSGQGLGIEIIGTLQLVLCVLATTDRRRRDLGGSAPLAIGLSVALGHLLAVSQGPSQMGGGREGRGWWGALPWAASGTPGRALAIGWRMAGQCWGLGAGSCPGEEQRDLLPSLRSALLSPWVSLSPTLIVLSLPPPSPSSHSLFTCDSLPLPLPVSFPHRLTTPAVGLTLLGPSAPR